MPRGKRKGRRRPHSPETRENLATPQTRAKLTPDPLALILMGQDISLEYAADEIYAVYTAICRSVMAKSPGFGQRIPGKGELTPEIAWAHSQTYMPWVKETGRNLVDIIISVIVDRNKPPFGRAAIQRALRDYAQRMRARPEGSGSV